MEKIISGGARKINRKDFKKRRQQKIKKLAERKEQKENTQKQLLKIIVLYFKKIIGTFQQRKIDSVFIFNSK